MQVGPAGRDVTRQSLHAALRLCAALTLAFAGSLSLARPVAAECLNPPPPQGVAGYRGFGFEAVVRTVSDTPSSQLPDAAPFDWEVRLDVTHVFRGVVPHRLVVDGYSQVVTCANFHGEFLRPGERLLITTDGLRRHDVGLNVLVWRHAPTGWRFDTRVVSSHDAANRFIPHAARAATTRAEIVALMRGELPDTASAGSAPGPAPATIVVAMLPVAAVVAAFLRRGRMVPASREP